jgi:hypothetical protein
MVFQDQQEHLIEPSDHISIDNNTPKKTVIACKDPSRKDTAMYSITVSNKHGTDSAEIEVVVLGKQNLTLFVAIIVCSNSLSLNLFYIYRHINLTSEYFKYI